MLLVEVPLEKAFSVAADEFMRLPLHPGADAESFPEERAELMDPVGDSDLTRRRRIPAKVVGHMIRVSWLANYMAGANWAMVAQLQEWDCRSGAGWRR